MNCLARESVVGCTVCQITPRRNYKYSQAELRAPPSSPIPRRSAPAAFNEFRYYREAVELKFDD